MSKSNPKLLLPLSDWPELDKELWHAAIRDDDPFSDAAGTRLAKSTLLVYCKGWRRFLGFLTITEPDALDIDPPQRLTAERVRRRQQLRETLVQRR
jgi:hypothetical protein